MRAFIAGHIERKMKPGNERIRNKLYIFLVCLAISVLMWFMINLSRDSISTLEYSVNFTNLPEGMALIDQPDSLISVRVSKGGLEMFMLKYFARKKTLDVDLSTLELKSQGRFFVATFPTSQLSLLLQKKYMFSEELISISPDLFYFRFEALSGKQVPVIPIVNATFQKLYRLSGSIQTIPDSVRVLAPQKILQAISGIETAPVAVKEVAGEVRVDAELVMPDVKGTVILDPSRVQVIIPSEKFTEIKIELTIESENKDLRIKTFPGKVEVTFLISLVDYTRINESMFRAVATISESQGNNRAPVKLITFPSYVEVVKIEPQEVEFLLLEND